MSDHKRIEPEVILEAWRELKKDMFFQCLITTAWQILLISLWGMVVIWAMTTDMLY